MKNQNQTQNEKPQSEMEKRFNGLSGVRKTGVIIAFLALVFGMIVILDYLGFTISDVGSNNRMFSFSKQTIWIINIGIGIVGGILCAPKKLMAAIISGAVVGAGITGLTFLYTSWRSSLIPYELLIPFFVSLIIGFKIFGLLAGESTSLSNDEFSIWTGPKAPKRDTEDQ